MRDTCTFRKKDMRYDANVNLAEKLKNDYNYSNYLFCFHGAVDDRRAREQNNKISDVTGCKTWAKNKKGGLL